MVILIHSADACILVMACVDCARAAEIFFGTTFRPSFVTVHKCDGGDLGSISLKMAAGSILNSAVKYVYPDRHFVGGKRTNKLHSGKRQENLVYRSSGCYMQLFQKLEGMWPPKSGPKTC